MMDQSPLPLHQHDIIIIKASLGPIGGVDAGRSQKIFYQQKKKKKRKKEKVE